MKTRRPALGSPYSGNFRKSTPRHGDTSARRVDPREAPGGCESLTPGLPCPNAVPVTSPCSIVLIAPEIPGNLGAVMRSCANFGAPLHAVEPFGFPLDAKALRRAAMDYRADLDFTRHGSFAAYLGSTDARRILLTTSGDTSLCDFAFSPGDHILFGNESSGAPARAHEAAHARIRIPARGRSLNLSVSVAIALWEALRQTSQTPSRAP